MSKAFKTILIVAAALILLGTLLFGIGFIMVGGRMESVIDRLDSLPFISLRGNYVVSTDNLSYRDWQNEYAPDGEYSLSADGIRSVSVDWIAGSIEVVPTDDQQIVFRESADADISAEEALRWGIDGDCLKIQYCKPGSHKNLPEKRLELFIPKELAGKLEDLMLMSVNADVRANGFTAEKIDVGTLSGTANITDCTAERTSVEAISGDVSFEGRCGSLEMSSISGRVRVGGEIRDLDVDSTSGNIECIVSGRSGEVSADSTSGKITLQCDADEVNADSTSGDVKFSGSAREISIHTASGEVDADFAACPKALGVDTTSGRVNIALPSDSAFTLEIDTASGRFEYELPLSMKNGKFICGSGDASFKIDTASGDVSIKVK